MKSIKYQRGHITLLTFLLFAVAALTIFGLYNVGQQTTTKVRLQTISDAAAHSVATVVARDLNFKAYTNRAMVANQIVIAQVVGLASWAQMFNRAATNINYVLQATQAIPIIGQTVGVVLARIGQALERGSAMINNAVDRAAPIMIRVQETLITALSASQQTFHFATIAMSRDTLNNVIEESDSDIDTGALASNGVFWPTFIRTWEGRQERYRDQRNGDRSRTAQENRERLNEFRDVTKASGDKFVGHRSYSWIPAISVPLVARMRMEKYGGSELMPGRTTQGRDNYQWTAMDSVSFEYSTWKWGWSPGWRSWSELFPVGWGAAHALVTQSPWYNYQGSRNNKTLWGDGTWKLPVASSLGASEEGRNDLTRNYESDGLRPFYDLKAKGRVPDDYLALEVLLLKRSDRVRTMNTVTAESPQFQTADRFNVEQMGGMAGDTMSGHAKAGVYFFRPNEADWVRPDRKREFGNLYNPYWQVRLLPTTNGERTRALAFAQIRM